MHPRPPRLVPSRVPLAALATLAALAGLPSPRLLAQARRPAAAPASSAPPVGAPTESPFRPLELPTPSLYRTGAGRPGPRYWQQRADYRIEATLDPSASTVQGHATLHYVNNSPDSLPYLWMHVEQNICAPNSVTNQLDQPPLVFLSTAFDFSCQGFAGGLELERLQAGGRDLPHTVYGTTMRVDLPQPLAPGAALDLDYAWRFKVPPYGAGRMGHDGPLYEIAQWYPRVAVYDDVRGWNHEPYIGAGEFYLEYGRFDVSLTVPASYVVAATGTLLNPEEVLTADQRARLERARQSDSAVAIVAAGEAGQPVTRPRTDGTLTWRFTADSVRDFAFAAAPNFRWDASAYRRDGRTVMVQTYYRPSAARWAEANRMTRAAVQYYSEQWFPYPYAHISSIEGPIEGMEYPMLTFDPAGPSREELHWVLAHELGHSWFPMIVGSNERRYPWMDEGFNTFIDYANAARYFKGTTYGDTIEATPLRLYPAHALRGREQPLMSQPTEVKDLFWVGYQKPALVLTLLRNEVLGRERFDDAFRTYIRAWAFKHPTPAEFFRLMRDASGTDLDWYWRAWVAGTGRLDQAVVGVERGKDGSIVRLANRGTMVMPLEMDLTYADGTRERVRLPVEMWLQGPSFGYRVRRKAVTGVVVDPRQALPDADRTNNRWGGK